MLGLYTYKDMLRTVDATAKSLARHTSNGQGLFYPARRGLGWEMAPYGSHQVDRCTSDAFGFRPTSREGAAAELPRVSIWGDSLVQGGEVQDSDSWPWLLQERLQTFCRVINGGVSGYGTDQAFLRMMDRFESVSPSIAILSYATTDLFRNVNVLRCFLHHSADFIALKPRYKLDGGGLALVEPPHFEYVQAPAELRKQSVRDFLRRHDAFYPRLISQAAGKARRAIGVQHPAASLRTEALEITKRIFGEFFGYCAERRVHGVALLLPVFQGRYRTAEDFDAMVDFFQRGAFPYVDLRPEMREASKDSPNAYFTPRNHYTRRAGQIIAERVAETAREILS